MAKRKLNKLPNTSGLHNSSSVSQLCLDLYSYGLRVTVLLNTLWLNTLRIKVKVKVNYTYSMYLIVYSAIGQVIIGLAADQWNHHFIHLVSRNK